MLHKDESRKVFYKQLLMLIIPISLQNLINVAVAGADIIMLGKLSEETMSAVSIANQYQYIYVIILFGAASGATVLMAQYWGKKDKRSISYVLGITLAVSIFVAMIFSILSLIFSDFVMGVFTNEDNLIKYGSQYLKIVGFSYIMQAIVNSYLTAVKSMERVIISTVTYALSLVINVVINYCLIFGKAGLPQLGVEGAAIGTLCARTFELLLVLGYAIKIKGYFKWHIKDCIFLHKMLTRDFFKYSMPIILNEFLWSLAISAGTVIYGHISQASVAANSVAQIVRELFMIFSFGLAVACSIRLGKTIGEHKFEEAKKESSMMISLSIKCSIVLGIVLFFVRGHIIDTFILSESARSYLDFMLIIGSVYLVAQTYTALVIIGIFRAGGDAKYGLFIDVVSMWPCSILFGSIFAFVLKLPIEYVILALYSDEFIKIPLCWFRYKKYKWVKDVTRE